MYTQLPNLDDDDLEEQMEEIIQSDSKIQQQLALLIHEMNPSERWRSD